MRCNLRHKMSKISSISTKVCAPFSLQDIVVFENGEDDLYCPNSIAVIDDLDVLEQRHEHATYDEYYFEFEKQSLHYPLSVARA